MRLKRLFFSLIFFAASFTGFAQALDVNDLMADFEKQMAKKNFEEALTITHQIIALQPHAATGFYARAKVHQESGRHHRAIADYTEALRFASKSPQLYYDRGSENLRVGRISESLADFTKTAELQPNYGPRLWQRGIALYEAGDFVLAGRQFELHQLVNSNDVENAAWHFASVARAEGFDKATNALIKIENDKRVPMMQIYSVFQGRGKVEDVFKIARFGYPPEDELKRRMFYGNFYIGLFFEAKGDEKRALEYFGKAVAAAPPNDYMSDIARVHLAGLKKRIAGTKTGK